MISIPSSGRSLLLIGLAAYLVFAVVSFPASLAVAWFLPDEIETYQVSGTAWSGHAGAIVTPHATLVDTDWSARPLSLLTARLGYRVKTSLEGGTITAKLSLAPNGTIRLRELSGVLPLAMLPPIVPSVAVDGRIGLDFAELRIEDQWPVDAEGTVDIVELRLVDPVAEVLGNYEVVFAGAGESGLEGAVSDLDGPLDVNGTLSLPGDRQWQFVANVKPNASASRQLADGLAYLGSRNADGSYTLTYPDR